MGRMKYRFVKFRQSECFFYFNIMANSNGSLYDDPSLDLACIGNCAYSCLIGLEMVIMLTYQIRKGKLFGPAFQDLMGIRFSVAY